VESENGVLKALPMTTSRGAAAPHTLPAARAVRPRTANRRGRRPLGSADTRMEREYKRDENTIIHPLKISLVSEAQVM
jgi:hypothetical protein